MWQRHAALVPVGRIRMHGLNLKKWQKWAFLAFYLGTAIYVYNGRLLEGLLEIIRIPMIDYILVFVLAGIFWLILKAIKRFGSDGRAEALKDQSA